MRITGGTAKSIPLKAPKSKHTRPATDQLREAVFSSLGTQVEGMRVADLFAGTGSYGLEALSRGAACVHFFESNPAALACLRENLTAVLRSAKLPPESGSVEAKDVFSITEVPIPYDCIFLDPPYAQLEAHVPRLFTETLRHLAGTHTQVILELPGDFQVELPGWQIVHRIGKLRKNKPTAAFIELR